MSEGQNSLDAWGLGMSLTTWLNWGWRTCTLQWSHWALQNSLKSGPTWVQTARPGYGMRRERELFPKYNVCGDITLCLVAALITAVSDLRFTWLTLLHPSSLLVPGGFIPFWLQPWPVQSHWSLSCTTSATHRTIFWNQPYSLLQLRWFCGGLASSAFRPSGRAGSARGGSRWLGGEGRNEEQFLFPLLYSRLLALHKPSHVSSL